MNAHKVLIKNKTKREREIEHAEEKCRLANEVFRLKMENIQLKMELATKSMREVHLVDTLKTFGERFMANGQADPMWCASLQEEISKPVSLVHLEAFAIQWMQDHGIEYPKEKVHE